MVWCGLAVSGVEVKREQKEIQVHVCASCMNTVVQTLGHLRDQITQLNREKEKLQEDLNQLRDEQQEQKQAMNKEIRVLEKKLALLKKKS